MNKEKQALIEHVKNQLKKKWPQTHHYNNDIFKYDQQIFEMLMDNFQSTIGESSNPFKAYLALANKFVLPNRYKDCQWLSNKQQQAKEKIKNHSINELHDYLLSAEYGHFFYPGTRARQSLKELADFTVFNAMAQETLTDNDTLTKEQYFKIIQDGCEFTSRFICIADSFAKQLLESDFQKVKGNNK